MTNPDQITCPHCTGEGTVQGVHNWSDGPGVVQFICPLCNGKKVLYQTVERIAIAAKQQAAEAQAELNALRTHLSLYLECLRLDAEGNQDAGVRGEALKKLRLQQAPGPSPWTSTWKTYMQDAARKAARR